MRTSTAHSTPPDAPELRTRPPKPVQRMQVQQGPTCVQQQHVAALQHNVPDLLLHPLALQARQRTLVCAAPHSLEASWRQAAEQLRAVRPCARVAACPHGASHAGKAAVCVDWALCPALAHLPLHRHDGRVILGPELEVLDAAADDVAVGGHHDLRARRRAHIALTLRH